MNDPQTPEPRTFPELTEASVAFLLDHQHYHCSMASLTIREWLEKIEAEASSSDELRAALDVERLARAMDNAFGPDVDFSDDHDGFWRPFAAAVAAEYARGTA